MTTQQGETPTTQKQHESLQKLQISLKELFMMMVRTLPVRNHTEDMEQVTYNSIPFLQILAKKALHINIRLKQKVALQK